MEVSELKVQLWPIDKVKPYDKNVKIHDEKQVKKIAESIQKFGWDQPIVVDKDGVIIKGHGRTLAAKSLGLKQVPVLVRDDLTPDQVKAARVADNRVAMGDIDTEMLQDELRSIDDDLSGIFDKKELKFLDLDLTELNTENVVEDIEKTVEEAEQETQETIEKIDEKEVRISQALGFRKVKGRDQRSIARFVARIEEETGKTGAEAFVEFAKNYTKK
nr:MAG TPA: ParB like protein [Caudoviricetes sp.]